MCRDELITLLQRVRQFAPETQRMCSYHTHQRCLPPLSQTLHLYTHLLPNTGDSKLSECVGASSLSKW